MDIIIKGGLVCAPDGVRKSDLGITDGRITRIGALDGAEAVTVIPAPGLILFPGGIDPHVHMELLTVSGQISSDDFASGSRAALGGGTTSLGDFAYPDPGERLIEAWRKRRALVRRRCLLHCFLHVAISENAPDLEEQIDECVEVQVRSFKVHMNDPRMDRELLNRICRHLARRDCLLLVHAEEGAQLVARTRQLVAEGKTGLASLALSHPSGLEVAAIEEVLRLARAHGTRMYIVHLTTRSGLEIIRAFKEEGDPVFAETCPQYLLLNDEKYREADGYCFTCVPPFRKDEDRQALWEGLADGSIDTLATDHCPFTRAQKDTWEGDFTRLPCGIPGVETRVPLFFSEGRKRGFAWEHLSRLVAGNAGRIFNLAPGRGELREGARADLFLYDPGRNKQIDYQQLHMNCDFSPYQGMEVEGWPVLTIVAGRIWEEGGVNRGAAGGSQ